MKISVDELEKVRNDYARLGKELEKERIIAIIEDALVDSDGYCRGDTVIALIKGEGK